MATHEFGSFDEAVKALGAVEEGDYLTYRMPYDSEVGNERHIVCNSEGRAMATCGWADDAAKIAEALDNVS